MARQQIADAYSHARTLAASIPREGRSARPRIIACLKHFQEHKEADDMEAAAWMLTAIQERIAEENLPDWETLKIVAEPRSRNAAKTAAKHPLGLAMIKEKLAEANFSFSPSEVALCERVFSDVCAAKQIVLDMNREEMANKIIWAFRHGVHDADDLKRLML